MRMVDVRLPVPLALLAIPSAQQRYYTSDEKCGFMPKSIPLEKAVELCREYRDKHKVRFFSQCWGCLKYSKEEPGKMCFYNEDNPTENRGCKFVNKLFDELN